MDKLNSRIPKTPIPIEVHLLLAKRFGPEYTLENMVLWLLEREVGRMINSVEGGNRRNRFRQSIIQSETT